MQFVYIWLTQFILMVQIVSIIWQLLLTLVPLDVWIVPIIWQPLLTLIQLMHQLVTIIQQPLLTQAQPDVWKVPTSHWKVWTFWNLKHNWLVLWGATYPFIHNSFILFHSTVQCVCAEARQFINVYAGRYMGKDSLSWAYIYLEVAPSKALKNCTTPREKRYPLLQNCVNHI